MLPQMMVSPKNEYEYPIDQCDVGDKGSLAVYREKRREWLRWLSYDDTHSISSAISSMAWDDVSFRVLAHAAEISADGSLANPLLAEKIIEGHFATQVLAIRRLVDRRPDVVSIRRLVDDLERNVGLFTRENYVGFDGLPYDYESVIHRIMLRDLGTGAHFAAKSGPDACWPSKRAHETFDTLSGVAPESRSRNDQILPQVFSNLSMWLGECDAENVALWSHKFLAHAADGQSRAKIDVAAMSPTLEKFTAAIRCFARVAEAVSAYVLFDSGHGTIVPVPQFDQFEKLDQPVLTHRQPGMDELWEKLADERDKFLAIDLKTLSAPTH